MPTTRMIGVRMTEREIAEFKRNCEWSGERAYSPVLYALIVAFNKASEESIVYGLTFELPLTLNTVKLPEMETEPKKKAVKK